MITIDTTTLATIINQCFANSADGGFTADQQSQFLTQGKRLRGLLVNLISAQFNDGTAAVLAANAQLKTVNQNLSDAATTLANAAARLNDIAALVANLDALLSLAAKFV
jgi:hypothetical protein